MLCAHLAELGFVANLGIASLAKQAEKVLADKNALPAYARTALEMLIRHIMTTSGEIKVLDRQLTVWHAESEASRRLAAIPGLDVITATALATTVTDPDQFRSGRQFAAWLGLTPRQHSTGGKAWRHLEAGRPILASIARCWSDSRYAAHQGQAHADADWIRKLLEKKPFRIVSVALANKLARIAWVADPKGGLSSIQAGCLTRHKSPELVMAVDDE